MRLSIVVPVYNVKQYLYRCIDSVIKQKISDYEIILVDDGSTDGSGELCDKIKTDSHNIRVIHQENGGLSAARNTGICNANGDYILLLDSDDYLVDDCLNKILTKIYETKCDVYSGYAFSVSDQGRKNIKGCLNNFPTQIMNGIEYVRLLDEHRDEVAFCAPFMIYKASFLRENDLLFKEGILHEDELWSPLVLLKAQTILWLDIPFYNHYFREGSIMNSQNYDRKANSMVTICESLTLEYNKYQDKDVKYLKDRLAMIYLTIAPHVENPKLYRDALGWSFSLKNSKHIDTFIKSFLFAISPSGYKRLYKNHHAV